MQAFDPFLDGYCNVHTQLFDYLKERTLRLLREQAQRNASMTTPEQVFERARFVREAFLDSIGGLPERPAGIESRVAGFIARDGYRIEKVVYESLPRVYVTSLLYVPDALAEPAPAVLFVCGHARDAKAFPEYQLVCRDLARNGFVALAVDPTGQGERVTHLDPDSGVSRVPWGTSEHSYQGLQCILTGTSIARHFLLDALRGLDYLQSRPEVDAARIGVTGNSGGGTQTTLLCMCGDDRVKAAVPATYVTSREHYFLTGQPQDAEQLQFAMTRNGINFDDMFHPFAPRPLLIAAVESDFFSPEGTVLTFERLRGVYRILGREEYVQCYFAPGGHRYGRELRHAAVKWFLHHLTDRDFDVDTAELDDTAEMLPEHDLRCTRKGHVLSDRPDAQTPFHLNRDLPVRPDPPPDPRALRDLVVDTLAIRGRLDSPVHPYPRVIRTQTWREYEVESVSFISEPGVMVAGALARPAGARPAEFVLWLGPGGSDALDAHLDAALPLLEAGTGVFVFDVRGTGAVKLAPINGNSDTFPGTFYNTEGRLAFDAYCLGESLLGMRVFDTLRAVGYLRGLPGVKRVGLRAHGLQPALWGYLAAALDDSTDDIAISGLIESFRSIVDTELYRPDFTPAVMLHGVLHRFDLPDLWALFEGRRVTVAKDTTAWRF